MRGTRCPVPLRNCHPRLTASFVSHLHPCATVYHTAPWQKISYKRGAVWYIVGVRRARRRVCRRRGVF